MSRAATYARVSREDERRILENQVGILRDYCAARGLELVAEYVDVASGGSDDRPGFSELLRDTTRARGRAFDVVVFTSLSRMTRGGTAAALEVLRVLERAGCAWRFTEQPYLDMDSGTPQLAREILLGILSSIDSDYRRRISTATKSAYARKKQSAEALGMKVRWGRPKRVPPAAARETDAPRMGAI